VGFTAESLAVAQEVYTCRNVSEDTPVRTKCKALTLNETEIILFHTLRHINQGEELRF
jgi:hypothetical protein